MKLKELSKEQAKKLLEEEYIKDGASKQVAKNSAKIAQDPVKILKEVFDYQDDSEIEKISMIIPISSYLIKLSKKILYHFDHPNREGASALRKAQYVEYNQFAEPVLAQLKKGTVAGYFCANCKYYEKKENTVKGGYCTLLKAQDAFFGCCDAWTYDSKKVKEIIKNV